MNRREKVLASVAGGLLTTAAAWFLLVNGDGRSAERLGAERKNKQAEIERQEKTLDASQREAKRLADWQRRALPANLVLARSLYQNWLRELAERAKFRQLKIESKEAGSKKEPGSKVDVYNVASFTLHARTSFTDLLAFLHEFYSAGHLHQIRRMDIKPMEDTHELDVAINIEALSLPKADRKDALTKLPGKGLQFAKLEEYREPIAQRDFFTPFSFKPSENKDDPAQSIFVTGFTEVNGVWQVWFNDRSTGKKWTLREGETVQIGDIRGTVKSIDPKHEVVVEFAGQEHRLHNGESLRGTPEAAGPQGPPHGRGRRFGNGPGGRFGPPGSGPGPQMGNGQPPPWMIPPGNGQLPENRQDKQPVPASPPPSAEN